MRLLKWAGVSVGSFGVLLLLAYGFVHFQTEGRLKKTYDVNPGTVGLTTENNGQDEALAWGRHIAVTRGCTDCHGDDLSGALFSDDLPVFRLFGSNLTGAGVGGDYTDADWVRAIRHGVGLGGRALLFMPSQEFYHLGDEDLASLILYLKNLPPVSRDLSENKVGPLGRILFWAGKLPLVPAEMINHDAPRTPAPARGRTVAYGEYLAVGCTGCHGGSFSGGVIPGVPPDWPQASNLTPDQETGLGTWTQADFLRAMREGRRPDGTELQTEYMPWPNIAEFGDDELDAIWMYLEGMEPKEMGGR